MRLGPITTISLTIAALLWAGCLPVTLQAAEPGMLQVSDNPGANTIAPPQCGCGCQSEPSCLSSVCDRFAEQCKCGAYWSFSADALALQRSNTRKQPLFYDANGAVLLDAEHFNSCTSVGFQLDAIRHGPCGWDLELGYFQVDGWIASDIIPGSFSLTTLARYWSALHLAELNVRRQWCEGLTLLAGFRAGELDEIFTLSNPVITDTVAATRTFNHLYGFQLGGEWECYNMGGPLRINALCKAGVYENVASHDFSINPNTFGFPSLEAHRNQAAFMGEAGAVATYDVTCHLSFRASLTAVWLEGVALAPEQVSINTSRTFGIDTSGGLFYYGGGLGMELRY
jgi:hypothetical protein